MVKHLPAMRETRIWSLGQEDPLEKEMAIHPSTLARKIPWTEEPGRLQSLGSRRVGMTKQLHFQFSMSCTGEGNGNPLQCSCLETPSDGGAWWAASYGITQSRTSWSDLAATAAAGEFSLDFHSSPTLRIFSTDKIIFRYRAISLFYTGIHSIFNSGRQHISQAYLWWMTLGSLGRIPIRIYFLWAQHWPVHFLVLQIELAIPNPFLAISNGFLVWNLFYCFFC